ncbi:MAG: ATPase, T2SS/T4P/T4SS family [Pirellulales bacterium]
MLAPALRQLDPRDPAYATRFVELTLTAARAAQASDVHFQPTPRGLQVAWRLDGVLQQVGEFPPGGTTDVVTRLKVLAQLLTYRTDQPQEGRARLAEGADWRVSTFPTLHGERAVTRLVSASHAPRTLTDLGLPAAVVAGLTASLAETAGVLLLTGPAGSGKTTTAYACLRELIRPQPHLRCVVSLEDPIESPLEGVAQSQVQSQGTFDLATGLRSILRQDPEVILVGEIRDATTAEAVLGAALTGHLVLTTFHASSAAGAVSRLAEMGIEPYVLRSGLRAVLHQRLLRRLCSCRRPASEPTEHLGLPVAASWVAVGCSACQGTGYSGRLVLAEWLRTEPTELGRAILSRDDAAHLARLARAAGLVPVAQQALAAVESGHTSALEVRRILGGCADEG